MRYLRFIAQTPLALRLALIGLLFNLALETSTVFMPLYAQSVGASNLGVGFVAAAWGLAYFLASLVFGRQSDIHGRLVFVRLGLGLSVIAYLSQMVTASLAALIAARAFVGFCLGITSGAIMAYTYENQRQIGRFASYSSLGWLVGAFAAAILRNYEALFLSSAVSSALAFLLSMTLPEEGNRIQLVSSLIPLLKANRKVYLAFIIRQMGSQAIFTIFALYASGIGASKFWIAVYDGINNFTQFIAMRVVERFNPAKVFRAGLLMSAIVFTTYGLVTSHLQLIPVQVLLGVAWSCVFVGALGYLLRRNEERGTVSGLLYSSTYLSGGIGPFLGGAASEVWGFGALMYVSAALAFTAFLSSHGLKLGGTTATVHPAGKDHLRK